MIIAGAPLAIEASKQVMLQSLEMPDLQDRAACDLSRRRAHARERGRQGRPARVCRETQAALAGQNREKRDGRFLRQDRGRRALLQDRRRVRRLQLRRHHRRLLAEPCRQVLHGEVELRPPAGARRADGRLHVDRVHLAIAIRAPSADETPVSLGYDRIRFLAPVYFGDTITVEYRVTAIDVERRRSTGNIKIKNQDGTLVTVGTHILKWVKNAA